MNHPVRLAVAVLPLVACTRRPIHDGQQVGPLVQVRDLFNSCFLLEYDPGRFALFDTCSQSGGVTRTLEDQGYGPEDVRRIFLTHDDPDHHGAAASFDRARIYAPWPDREAIEGAGVAVRKSVFDATSVALGRYTVRAFSVPGHTPGSTVYEVGRVLVMGDVVIAQRDGRLAAPADRTSEDPEQNVRSVRALARQLEGAEVDLDWIAPAHSGPVYGLQALYAF